MKPEFVKIFGAEGTAIYIMRDEIDTDEILPAEHLLEETFEGMDKFAFSRDRYKNGKEVEHQFHSKYMGAKFIFTGKAFGCGSSREHAAQGVQQWGIRVIVAPSISPIYEGNSEQLGMIPAILPRSDIDIAVAYCAKNPDAIYTLDIESQMLRYGNTEVKFDIKPSIKASLLGGFWNPGQLLIEGIQDVIKIEETLPFYRTKLPLHQTK